MSSGFSTQEIKRMLGLSPARLRAYVKAGLLCPQRGHGGELRFSFQDLLLLRTAEGLVTERLPPRRVRDALRKLRQRMPTEHPLTGVQLDTDGGHVVVRAGGTTWHADSGQVLLSFGGPTATVSQADGEAPPIALRRPEEATRAGAPSGDRPEGIPSDGSLLGDGGQPDAEYFYQLGCGLEDDAPEAARAAYLNALALDPGHPEAHLNLGRLMHEAGDLDFAEEQYREALALRAADSTAYFNLGVVLEDRGRADAAVRMYEAALDADPGHADAHFNAARLHDLAGRYEAALRHLREYRNLTGG